MSQALIKVFICWHTLKKKSLLLIVVTQCSIIVTCSILSLMPLTEPVPLSDWGEEQRGGEDPAGERGWSMEGLLWRRLSGDSGRVCHEIRSGVHLSGYDVSTTLIYGLLPHPSVIVLFGRVEERRRSEKERRRNRGVVKMSPQQNQSLEDYRAPKFDWLIAGLLKKWTYINSLTPLSMSLSTSVTLSIHKLLSLPFVSHIHTHRHMKRLGMCVISRWRKHRYPP